MAGNIADPHAGRIGSATGNYRHHIFTATALCPIRTEITL
jgi:hypothetical protein